MSLASQVASGLTRLATEVKLVRNRVGDLTGLTTTAKTSVVDAINEVKSESAGAPPDASTTVKGIVELATTGETTTGTDTARAVTPAGVAAAIAPKADTSSLSAVATSGDAADLTGVLGTAQLPPLAINDTFPVDSQSEMLELTAQRGDVAIRSDNGLSYILATDSPSTLADWKQLTSASDVTSVAGKTGAVTLVKGDVGLGSVDNTSDEAKPVSTAQQSAINNRQPLDATLTAIAGLTTAANTFIYATGADTFATASVTTFGRSLLDDANAAAGRTTLDVYSKAEIGDPETDFVGVVEAALA